MDTILKVKGMSCSHCEDSIKAAVSAMPGVTDVQVDLPGKTVTVAHDEAVSFDAIKGEIEDQGFDVL